MLVRITTPPPLIIVIDIIDSDDTTIMPDVIINDLLIIGLSKHKIIGNMEYDKNFCNPVLLPKRGVNETKNTARIIINSFVFDSL